MRRCTHRMMVDMVMEDHQKRSGPLLKPIGNQTVTVRLKKLAMGGDAAAQYRMGCCYAQGLSVERDEATARIWYKMSADQGHVPAMLSLGEAHFHGDGLGRNRILGLYWLKKAANRGSSDACYLLGITYYNGDEVLPRRFDLAVKWLRKAANLGSTGSMTLLGHCYRHGLGVEQNIVAAFVCITVAAKRAEKHPRSLLRTWGVEDLTDEQLAEVQRLSKPMLEGNLDFEALDRQVHHPQMSQPN